MREICVGVRLNSAPIPRIMERMDWTTPQLDEIKMDAEIGSYQEDGDGERTPIVTKLVLDASDAREHAAE